MRVELHFHLLPGVDDGPETMEDSLELARAAVAQGTGTVVATPHVRPDFVTDPWELPARVRRAARRARRRSDPAHGPVRRGDRARRWSAGSARPSSSCWPRDLRAGAGCWWRRRSRRSTTSFHAATSELRARGFDVLIAHPERSADAILDDAAGSAESWPPARSASSTPSRSPATTASRLGGPESRWPSRGWSPRSPPTPTAPPALPPCSRRRPARARARPALLRRRASLAACLASCCRGLRRAHPPPLPRAAPAAPDDALGSFGHIPATRCAVPRTSSLGALRESLPRAPEGRPACRPSLRSHRSACRPAPIHGAVAETSSSRALGGGALAAWSRQASRGEGRSACVGRAGAPRLRHLARCVVA